MQIVYGREPSREYDKAANKFVVIVADKAFYDEGYRTAEQGEEVSVTEADAEALVAAKQAVEIADPNGPQEPPKPSAA